MIILIVLLIGAIVFITYFVGDYFVRYSLIPNSGAEERKVASEEHVSAMDLSTATGTVVSDNYFKEKQLKEKWLEEMQVEAREVRISSHDGLTLSGHQFEHSAPTNHWAILVHGYQSNENETFTIGRHFYEEGYNVLTIALRAHGNSEGKYIGMGYLDKDDLVSWTNYLVDQHPDSEIIYHGTSMGGATVLMASGLNLPNNVKAVVSDCAYSSLWDIFASELNQRFSLPPFPGLYMAQIMAKIRAGYDVKDGNVAKFVEQGSLPTLFIHTTPDDFVPVSMAQTLYDAKIHGVKDLQIVEEGGHAAAKFVNPEKYYSTIFNFTDKYV